MAIKRLGPEEVARLREENEELRKQVATLQKLPKQVVILDDDEDYQAIYFDGCFVEYYHEPNISWWLNKFGISLRVYKLPGLFRNGEEPPDTLEEFQDRVRRHLVAQKQQEISRLQQELEAIESGRDDIIRQAQEDL